MIYICLVRRAQCEICLQSFDLDPEESYPQACKLCGSREWLYGVDEIETRRIRMFIKRAEVALNPGARSLKRQAQGRRQYQGFKSQEEVDARRAAGEN